MDGRCATCRWWDASDAKRKYLKDEWGFCDLANADPIGYGDDPANAVSLFHTDDPHSALKTHRTFGCVQWEAR